MVFKALKEGATKLEVSDYTSYLYSDETLNLTTGDSTVTVEAGDGTSSESLAGTTAVATGTGNVEVDGVTYTIYNDFSDALVPDGCSRTTMEYNGETVNAILQETSGKYFVYLVEADKDPVMALYNEKDNSFAITEMVSITDSSYIFLLGTKDGKGDGTVSELEYTMVFKALKEGATKLEVSDYTSYLYSDETLNLTTGDSTVTVEAGDGTSSESLAGTTAVATGTGNVEVDGVTYTIYNDFSDALVPDGCSRTTMEYNGETVNAILQETSGKYFVYLVEADKDPVMALYNEKDNSFAITEMVSITDSSYIFLLGTKDGKGLRSQVQKTKLTVGSLTYPVSQNSESEDFYLMYALDESGEES